MPEANEEELISEEYLYQGKKIKLKLRKVRYKNKNTGERAIIEHPGAVAIVALNEHDEVYLVRQSRPATGKILLEIPAGTREQGETPEVTAYRELQEEIGFAPGSLTLLSEFYTAPGFCDEYMYLYLAQHLLVSQLPVPEDEDIEVVLLSLEDALAAIMRKEISDAKSIIGLNLVAQQLKEKRAVK